LRKELQAKNTESFLSLVESQCDVATDKILVVVAQGLNHGVTGIAASQISRQYNRPVILLILEGDIAMGAARSVGSFNIVDCIASAGECVIKFGGHSQAAGLSVTAARIEEFRNKVKETASKELTEDVLAPVIDIDADLDPNEVNKKLLSELQNFEPFGAGNPNPVFALRQVKVLESSLVGLSGNHIKLKVSGEGARDLTVLGWGFAEKAALIKPDDIIDIAFHLEENVWNDKKTLQLSLVDIRPSEIGGYNGEEKDQKYKV
jgi:single-stranded-DNA-specific exonuclease